MRELCTGYNTKLLQVIAYRVQGEKQDKKVWPDSCNILNPSATYILQSATTGHQRPILLRAPGLKISFDPLPVSNCSHTPTVDEKFQQYFDKLFNEANIPGPDYFEFSKMTEAMHSIPNETARYTAAFAGLAVQGLDKQKLLSTARQYLQVLETDTAHFNTTVDAALQEKVHGKKNEVEEKNRRIQQLAQEISELQNQVALLLNEIKDNEDKIEASTGGYKAASKAMKNKILSDIQKIQQHIS